MQEELKELIKLNKKEALLVIKDYLSLYFYSFIKDKDNTRRNILLEKLKEYLAIIKEENKYYKFLIENIHKIKDEEAFDAILDKLDVLNEKTYNYFDNILLQYDDSLNQEESNEINLTKDFKTLLERTDIKEETISLTTTFYDVINYFSKDDAMTYLVPRTKFLESGEDLFGCFLKDEDNILKEIRLVLPQIKNKETLEECIYLYEMGILMYHHLYSEVPKGDFRSLAIREIDIFKKQQLKRI